ncbi:Matrixin family protein, putative [Theobroma cacao]|uniref:Matrixin family protein, putative n=1 Tax=Theobroma cacao TaxID=3641 RepID=A0A061EIP3_THECC|nr:Matrixin family protein, putative [Theobroma cacao]
MAVWFGLDIGHKVNRDQITSFDEWFGKVVDGCNVEPEPKKKLTHLLEKDNKVESHGHRQRNSDAWENPDQDWNKDRTKGNWRLRPFVNGIEAIMEQKFEGFKVQWISRLVQALVVQSEIQFSNSLQFLQGAQKGYKVKGLNHVKQYFKAFGYYPNHINLTDDYDDSLESALKKYQENYRLKVTGRIDPDTIKEMLIPRCGVADIFNESNSEYDKLDMVANYTFFDGMPKWSKRQLTYTFRSSAIVISVQQLRPIIARAFEKWAAVSQFTFRQAPTFTQADIVIGFHRRFHWDNYPFDGPGNVLAHAFAPQDGRFHYDADENWSTNPTTVNQIDVESVAVHEIGHLLGLGHSRDPNAIMFALYMPGTIKRNLGQDDIDGMRALYS